MRSQFHGTIFNNAKLRCHSHAAFLAISAAVLAGTGVSAFATVSDVGQYLAGKTAYYLQTGNSSPTIASSNPYEFQAEIGNGSSGSILTSSTLTPPAGATGSVTFTPNSGNNNIKYQQYYASTTALDAAFPNGNYAFTINTSTPNTYSATLGLSGLTYPTDIPAISGATWSGGNLVIDPNVDNTISWNASNDLHLSFDLNNANINESVFNSGSGLPSSYMIAANTLLPGQTYIGQLDFANGVLDTSQISGVMGAAYYQNSTQFTIVTTPDPAAGIFMLLGVATLGLLARRRSVAQR